MRFPLISNFRMPIKKLSLQQYRIVRELNRLIQSRQLPLVDNLCPCGAHEDVLIAKRDTYGVRIPFVMCKKCGLVRLEKVFTDSASDKFYMNYYRPLYDFNWNVESYFSFESQHSNEMVGWLESMGLLSEIAVVVEMGCGAGGCLTAFASRNKKCIGVDLGEDYIMYGKSKQIVNLDLQTGDFYDVVPDGSCDLLILSHVLEHLKNPVDAIRKVLPKIKENKYLYVEVPSLHKEESPYEYTFKETYPVADFQLAHTWYFYEEWLQVLFTAMGLKVLTVDNHCEGCRVVCQKVTNITPDISFIDNHLLESFCLQHIELFKEKRIKTSRIPKLIKYRLFPIACFLGIR